MEELIFKLALANAIKFNGKANPGAVIGGVFAHDSALKGKAKEVSKLVQDAIKKVNAMSVVEQEKQLAALGGIEEKKKERREGLKPLNNVKGKVVMRFEPSPSGPLHIGHAYVGSLNASYCKQYDGQLIVRVSDTNPENIYVPAYEQLKDNAEWLWGKVDYYIQSDRMQTYYDYMEKMFDLGKVYVCTCDPENFREYSKEKKACPCRDVKGKDRWKEMFTSYKQGDAVVRFKSTMDHKNPAMRDFPLMRINDSEHPRQGKKYRVWPLMNWSVFVDDLTTGVTHSIRGKDHADNEKRQRMMFDALGKKAPEALFVGRINFEGFAVSCSKTKVKIDNGEYTGWDDIRIPFIPALRRRGYQPEVFVKYAEDVGVSLNDKTVQIKEFFKVLNHHNKELIDGKTIRRLFVANPKEVTVENDVQELMVENHPENDLGSRKVLVGDKFYVSDSISDGVYRFMHLFNFENGKMVSKEYDADLKAKIVHAVPMSGAVDVSVMMDDGTTLIGKGEKALLGLEEGSIVQFERMFFAKLDSKEDMRFVYLHG